jgi:hypothetical protein
MYWQDRLNITEHALQAWNLSGTCFIGLMWLIQAELKPREREREEEKKNDDHDCFSLIPVFYYYNMNRVRTTMYM